MIHLREKYATKSLEHSSSSTGKDHFRHIYSFIDCLYNVLIQNQLPHRVNYDTRERFAITDQQLPEYNGILTDKLHYITNHISDDIIVESTVYPTLYAESTIARELHILLSHEMTHHTYFSQEYGDTEPHIVTYEDIIQADDRTIELPYLLTEHIVHSFEKYNDVVQRTGGFPLPLVRQYTHLYDQYAIIRHMHPITKMIRKEGGHIADTSVIRELYYIEEAVMHLLYDIRLFIMQYHPIIYKDILLHDPHFGIAHATILHNNTL